MVRRSFRFGLRLGLLFGVAVALVKTVQSRRSTPEAAPKPAPWEPITEKAPVRPAEPPVREVIDEVGEPILEFSETELRDPPAQVVEPVVDPVVPDPVLDIVPETPVKAPAVKKVAKKAAAPTKAPSARRAARKAATPPPAWVEAQGNVCPPTHPVKAKMASRLFHLPGMFAYDRTRPDRCYLDAPTAIKDGFNSAKR